MQVIQQNQSLNFVECQEKYWEYGWYSVKLNNGPQQWFTPYCLWILQDDYSEELNDPVNDIDNRHCESYIINEKGDRDDEAMDNYSSKFCPITIIGSYKYKNGECSLCGRAENY